MRRIVLDVNVIVSGFPSLQSVPGSLVQMGLEAVFQLILSEHIIQGVQQAWRKPYFQQRFDEDRATASIHLLRQATIIVEPEFVTGIAPDEEDDRVLGTALAGSAGYLVTGDHGLLRLHSYRGVEIISPSECLLMIAAGFEDSDR